MPKLKTLSARDRILQTAYDLFYRQGYHQTGINQIIEESGAAKATFYSIFKSKEDLCVEYLSERSHLEIRAIKDMIKGIKEPHDKYMAIVKGLVEFMEESNFRGCAFNNMAIEVTEPTNPIRKEVKYHNDAFRSILRDVAQELKDSAPKYGHLNVEEISDTYFLIVEGAIVSSQHYHNSWPIKHAIKAIERLVE